MREMPRLFPDPAVLVALQPEELGAKILFLLRQRLQTGASDNGTRGLFDLQSELLAPWPHFAQQGVPWAGVTLELRNEVSVAITEAWTWLRAQGLVITSVGSGSWEMLSRRARAFESAEDFQSFATARLLPRDILHPQLAQKVWLAFMRGDFDFAVFYAMKTVEIRVREAARLGQDLVGVKLMRKAFDVEKGPLTDMAVEAGEREACAALFVGAIGSYKNPQSHREVNLSDPARALEVVLLANHLLSLIDLRAEKMANGG